MGAGIHCCCSRDRSEFCPSEEEANYQRMARDPVLVAAEWLGERSHGETAMSNGDFDAHLAAKDVDQRAQELQSKIVALVAELATLQGQTVTEGASRASTELPTPTLENTASTDDCWNVDLDTEHSHSHFQQPLKEHTAHPRFTFRSALLEYAPVAMVEAAAAMANSPNTNAVPVEENNAVSAESPMPHVLVDDSTDSRVGHAATERCPQTERSPLSENDAVSEKSPEPLLLADQSTESCVGHTATEPCPQTVRSAFSAMSPYASWAHRLAPE